MTRAIFLAGVLALTGALFGGPGLGVPGFGAGEAAAQSSQPYRLRPGDRVEVSVLEDPTLNRQALVLPDGRVSLPIAGTLVAAGMTPEQLASRIQSELSSLFVSPPTVTVSPTGIAEVAQDEEEVVPPDQVFVLGEVRNPGAFAFETPMTVLQFLAVAGGPGPFAARDRIQIHHKGEAEGEAPYIELFDYEALEEGEAGAPEVELANGDIIVVPERGLFD